MLNGPMVRAFKAKRTGRLSEGKSMRMADSEDVLDLLESGCAAAATGAAMELGLFWLLSDNPLSLREISQALGIPVNRCQYWLQMLSCAGLIEEGPGGYEPSTMARSAILGAYSRESWALLAQEARERLPRVQDLALRLGESNVPPPSRGRTSQSYVIRMSEDPDRARRFTRMLYEIHSPLADTIARSLDMTGVTRLMDLGGGSGVVSMALLGRNPDLSAVVVDIASVCAAGHEIAVEKSMEDRISYHAADFVQGDLPAGFDVVLECDVNIYSEALFRRIRDALNPGGRFVVIDYFAPAEGVAPPSRVHWALENSMLDPGFSYPTAADVKSQLQSSGFRLRFEGPLSQDAAGAGRYASNLTMIEAHK